MNLPNALSLFRLLLTPVFALVFFSGRQGAYPAAAAVFAAAALTDVLDGYIARKHNSITKLGRVLDPLADKLMKATAAFCLTYAGVIPVYVLIFLVCKELMMLIGVLLFYRKVKDVPSSNIFGKAAEALICLLIILHILLPVPATLSHILWLCAIAAESAALAIYIITSYRSINQAKEETNED